MKVGEGGVGFLRRRKAEMGGGEGGSLMAEQPLGIIRSPDVRWVEGHLLTRGGRPEKGVPMRMTGR